MAGLLDLFGGGGDPADIYGDLFTEKQRAALRDQQMTDTLLRLSAGFAKAGQASRLPTGGLLGALGEAAGGLAGTGDEAMNRMLKGMQVAEEVRQKKSQRAFQEQHFDPLMLEWLKRRQAAMGGGVGVPGAAGAPASRGGAPGGPIVSNAPPPPPIGAPNAADYSGAGGLPGFDGDFPGGASPLRGGVGSVPPGAQTGLLPPPDSSMVGNGVLPQLASLYGGAAPGTPPFDPTTLDPTAAQGSPDRPIRIEQLGSEALPVEAPFPTLANPNKPRSAWQQGTRYDRGDTPFDPARPYATPQQFASPPSELDRLSQFMRVETVAKPAAASNLTGSAWEIANNNFGGMRRAGVNATPSQGGFQTFATPEAGLGAISNQLDRYASGATTGKPLSTIREIVSTWAPPSENDTEALIKRASRVMGVADNIPLNLSDPAVKAKLIEATVRNEQGGKLPVDPALIGRVAEAPPGTYAASTGGGGFSGRIEPLGGTAVPAGAGGQIPGLGIDPESLALMNMLAKRSGLGEPFNSLLETYYKSPDYLMQAEAAKQLGGLPFEGPKAAAIAKAQQQYIQQNAAHQSDLDIAKDLIIKGGLVQQPDGSYKQITSIRDGLAAVEAAKPTGDIKEYDYYRKQTLEMGQIPKPFAVWDVERRKASATSINTSEGFEAAQTKARVGVDAKIAQDVAEQAITGRRLMPVLDELSYLADKTPEGWRGTLAPTVGKTLATLGVPVPQGASNAEAFQALAQRLVPIVREPGATSQGEMALYLQAGPSLSGTANGRRMIIDINRAMIQRSQEIAKTYRENIGKPDLYEKLATLDKPLFTEEQRAAMQGAAATPAAATAGSAPLKGGGATGTVPRPMGFNPATNHYIEQRPDGRWYDTVTGDPVR